VGVAVAFTVVEIGKWGGAVLSPTYQFLSQEFNSHDEAVVFLLCQITIGVTVKIPSTQGSGRSAFCSATIGDASVTVSGSSGKEPGSFRSVQLITVCPIVPSHLCSI
jgi:hypothetical protein